MEQICSPYAEEGNRCQSYIWLTAVPYAVWSCLGILEVLMRSKKVIQEQIPMDLQLSILFQIFLHFIQITVLLFGIPESEVSGAEFLYYFLLLFSSVILLYMQQMSYKEGQIGCSDYITLKLFWPAKFIWSLSLLAVGFITVYQGNLALSSLQIFVLFFSLYPVQLVYEKGKAARRYQPLIEPDIAEEDDQQNCYDQASFIGKLFLMWVLPTIKLGKQRPLETSDIQRIRHDENAEVQMKKLEPILSPYINDKTQKYALLKGIYKAYFWEVLFASSLGVFGSVLEFVGPTFILLMDNFLKDDSVPFWKGPALVAYLLIAKIFQAILKNQSRFMSSLLGTHLQASLSSIIYQKTLKVSKSQVGEEFSFAVVVNLVQVDLTRLFSGIPYSLLIIYWPIQMGLGIYMLFATLDWQPALAGFGVMFICFGVNILVSKKIQATQRAVMEKKDGRMKLLNELLNNMKIFKIYNWEEKLGERVQSAREQEVKVQTRFLYWMAASVFLNWGTRNYLGIALVDTKALLGQTLEAGQIFAGMSVIGILNMSIRMIPDILNNMQQMLVSMNRIQNFLRSPNIVNQYDYERAARNPSVAIQIQDCSFSWKGQEKSENGELQEINYVLKNINVNIRKGELVAVVGRIGSGKSSIIQAIINNLIKHDTGEFSSIYHNGRIAYVSQEAWIQNRTIRDNIIFGSPYDEQKYQEVLRVCQLKDDLAILPGGDQTEIGEKGINLSGGQKARVAIARAVYSDADIILLDDPLSAVDAHVGRYIFNECIRKYLAGKTRLLVTNNQQFLPKIDRIIVLNNGQIVEEGGYQQLISDDGYFKNEYLVQIHHDEDHEEQDQKHDEEVKEQVQKGTNIIESEDRQTGTVSFEVYKIYYKYLGGMIIGVLVLSFMVIWQIDRMWTDIFLSEWTEQSQEEQEENLEENVITYTVLAFMINIFILCRLLTVSLSGIRASKFIFNNQFTALLNAPINKFYDITPIGRILNRLSKDQATVDGMIILVINGLIGLVFGTIVVFFIAGYIVPYSLIIIPFAIYTGITIRQYYAASSREIMRLETISRSPILQNFSESYAGSEVIRAYGFQNQFYEKNTQLINQNSEILFIQQGCNAWLGVALESVTDMLLAFSTLFLVMTRGLIDKSLAGLLLYYIMGLPDSIYWTIFVTTYVENSMVSVERTHSLAQTLPEAARVVSNDENLIQRRWPSQGLIEFRNYYMKYRQDTELVLKDVNFIINPGEKVGIVGRTGSGKSSLCMALFRIVEPQDGQILIDGVNVMNIGLNLLRRSICVIPQDPTLFQGDVRYNLDPFAEVPEANMISILQLLFPDEDPKKFLDSIVEEGGNNFSVGQRQLICIARAVIRKVKIMFLDEATASIDYKTDEIIQKAIREQFSDRTVLTIAHRINTISDYDRILVMDAGTVAEFDTPQNLEQMKGIYYSLLRNKK